MKNDLVDWTRPTIYHYKGGVGGKDSDASLCGEDIPGGGLMHATFELDIRIIGGVPLCAECKGILQTIRALNE